MSWCAFLSQSVGGETVAGGRQRGLRSLGCKLQVLRRLRLARQSVGRVPRLEGTIEGGVPHKGRFLTKR